MRHPHTGHRRRSLSATIAPAAAACRLSRLLLLLYLSAAVSRRCWDRAEFGGQYSSGGGGDGGDVGSTGRPIRRPWPGRRSVKTPPLRHGRRRAKSSRAESSRAESSRAPLSFRSRRQIPAARRICDRRVPPHLVRWTELSPEDGPLATANSQSG